MPIVLYSLLTACLLAVSVPSFAKDAAVSLEDYLKYVSEHAEELRAVDMDIESLHKEIEARDLDLSPELSVELLKFWDKRPSLSSSRQIRGKSVEATLSKPLATGTTLSLSSSLETSDYASNTDEQNLISWQFGVTQSLWQNSFGRQTSFRRARDRHELQSRLLTLTMERQQLLSEFELMYWEITYRLEELKVRQENLERSQRIFAWTEERFKRSAAERVDVLQAQTLMLSRDMQLQLASETLESSQARLREKLGLKSDLIPLMEELDKERSLEELAAKADFAPAVPVLIESLQSKAQGNYLTAVYQLESDQLRPELELGYAYGRQGLSSSFSTARRQAFSGSRDNEYQQIGVVFSMPLDLFLITKSRFAKQIAAKAQELRAVKAERQSAVDWQDIASTIARQQARLKTARMLASAQEEKSAQEQERYQKGRITTFQAVTVEQDAAESRLLVYQLLYQLRQTEVRGRMYIVKEGR